jgi:glucose-6-phosphate isomerase
LEISIPVVNEEMLGQLFFLFSGVTAFLGEFMQINAFDQPGVERSKVLTKQYLQKMEH